MGMENYSLSDIRAVTDNDGFGGGMGGGWFAWILLFALFGGGNGFGFGGNRGNVATTEDLASGFNFNSLQSKTNDILAAVNNNNQVLGNAICQLGYQELQNINGLERQIADCCCTTQRAIDGVKFDMANYSAATNATITAGVQKILDKMCADQTAALQARVQSLELQQALCGIPRTSPYGYGIYAYPTCNPCSPCGGQVTMG